MAIARFTPSLMPRETLEAIFVARQPLLRSIVDRVLSSVTTDERHHTLVVGPRGSGKTHLLSLVNYGAVDLIAAGHRLQLAWLPEDPWTVASYRHLLAQILSRLSPNITPASSTDAGILEEQLLEAAAGQGPVVVLLENLDQILVQIGETGQRQLRHLLQTTGALVIVATTTRLDRNLTDTASPFFGFFTPIALRSFTVDEAQEMLIAVARENGDSELVRRLETPLGRARLQVVSHLAGGQPRLWAALASALTIDKLDELAELLISRFDDLTPYYQEQLARLSPHQRLVIAELVTADRPLHVTDLAARLGIDRRSVAKTLSELSSMQWVETSQSVFLEGADRRRSYYELAEPLARLSFQLKESRGEPIRLVVDFLKGWFDPAETKGAGEYALILEKEFVGDGVGSAIRRLSGLPATRASALAQLGAVDDALLEASAGRGEAVMGLPTPLRVVLEEAVESASDRLDAIHGERIRVHLLALDEVGDVPARADETWARRAMTLRSVDGGSGIPQSVVIQWLAAGWHFDRAQSALASLVLAVGEDDPSVMPARDSLASAFLNAGRGDDAVKLYARSLEVSERLLGRDHVNFIVSEANLAHAHHIAGRVDVAVRLYADALEHAPRVLDDAHPSVSTLKINFAAALLDDGEADRGVALLEEVVAAREANAGRTHPGTLTALNNLAGAYEQQGKVDLAIDIAREVLRAREDALGPDDPQTLASRNNLASYLETAGDLAAAIDMYEVNLSEAERLLGPDHPHTITSRSNLGFAMFAAGRLRRAVELWEQSLEQRRHLLGDAHPLTLLSVENLAIAYRKVGEFAKADSLDAEAARSWTE
ncbi:tetratricopeptide repeat protein [Microbacterium sp. Kw_RZR3]|uniref:tetratricopeptide repeat protein n=1 Tax=Microbacterium sp. Kw_RZR3 TaxID=3032903 RepID=UPI0023DA4D36|nr:tetratricopeptide repeat protein [Microbacterium sp. Kw_RZR3]MDF2048230.1 tetratricopeptide repeat protein [Microbacterium sp. Kw_RZR3]